jgi:HPt (histidine-containing phosphotransfer) domain-containing protein
MDDYISKPIRVGDLQSALERWGRGKIRKPDTAFLQRPRTDSPENLLDQAVILELCNLPPAGAVGMLQELVDLFLENVPQRIAQISQSINDGPMLAFHAHALKSMSLNLGAKRVVELSQKLEELGRSRNMHGAPALLRELENAFAQTKNQLLILREQ